MIPAERVARATHVACGGDLIFDPEIQSGPGSLSDVLTKHRCAVPRPLPSGLDDIALSFHLGGSAWKLIGKLNDDEVRIQLWHDQTMADEIRAKVQP